MLELAVKTLDGKNRSFCVPDDITVKEFKEKIANSIDITADTQRLIYQGRVLQDEKKLSEYNVNGKTIHVVQRPPPSQQGPAGSASASAGSPPRTTGMPRDGDTFVLGSFTLPVNHTNVQNITQQVLTGMGDLGRNAHVSSSSSNDGSSVDVHIHLGQVVPPQLPSESQLRVDQARRMIQAAQTTLERLENPPSGPEEEEETSAPGAAPMQTPAGGTPASGTSTSGATASGTEGQSATGSSRNSSRPGSPQHPASTVLGDLLTETMTLNERLQPHLATYQQLMANDPKFDDTEATRRAQRTFNLVSQALHYVSHAYHNISDLMIDMHRAPPRRLRAPPSMLAPHPIPMQAQVNVQTSVPSGTPWPPSGNPTSATTATSTPTTTASNPTSDASTTTTSNASSQTSRSVPGGPMRFSTTPLPGGGTANVASSNPYVFMELGPHAVTINSISAHVVSTENDGAPPTSNTAPAPGGPNPTATTFTTNTTNTQPSPSAGPRTTGPAGGPGTPRPHGPRGVHMQMPMGPGGFGPGAGSMVPPEVMQNILQMVTQQAFPRPPAPSSTTGESASQSRSTSTSTSATSSSSTTSGGSAPTSNPQGQRTPTNGSAPEGARQGGMPPHAAFVIPGVLPGMGPGQLPVDPHLPCESHHFISERAQLQANNQNAGEGTLGGMMANIVSSIIGQNPHTDPAGPQQPRHQQQGSRSGQATSTPTGPSARAGPRPSAQPFNFGAGLRPFGFGTMGLRPQAAAGATATSNTQTRSTTTQSTPSSGATTGTSANEPAFMAALRQFLQEGQQQQQRSQPASQGENRNTGQAEGEGEFTDEVFAQLVRGISNYVAQAALGRPTDTIANFLSSLGENYNISPSEGLLMEVFNVVAGNLTFTDIMAVFYGQPRPLQTLQRPLHDMVRDRILQDNLPTEENINSAVERLMTDITPEIEQACENAEGRDDIDVRATLLEFTRHHLRVAIRFIIESSSADDQFGQHLYTLCQQVIHEFITLGVHCLQGREQALQRLIEQQMRHITRGVNPAIQQWMVSIPIREMTRMLGEINIPVSEIETYIRHRGSMETSPVPSEGSFMSAESEYGDPMTEDVALPANGLPPEQEAMDIDSPSASVTVNSSPPEAVSAAEQKLPPPPTADPQDEVDVVIGSETWHREVPEEWVPVIARDVRRQSREAPQPPFSDAYLQGMPAKRRKIGERKTDRELTDLSNIIPETLRRAVVAAGAETLTSIDSVTEEASASLPLHNAFEQQVCESVRERISRDPDFSADRFPNADKFFKKGK